MPTDILVVQPTKTMFMLGALLWSGAGFASPFLLPSQDTPNFYNAKMCRDRQVLSALKTAATNTLKTKVIVAGGDGPKWSGYQPDNIHLEAVSIISKDLGSWSVKGLISQSVRCLTASARRGFPRWSASRPWLLRSGSRSARPHARPASLRVAAAGATPAVRR